MWLFIRIACFTVAISSFMCSGQVNETRSLEVLQPKVTAAALTRLFTYAFLFLNLSPEEVTNDDGLAHPYQLSALMKKMRSHPELREIVDKGDFKEAIKSNNYQKIFKTYLLKALYPRENKVPQDCAKCASVHITSKPEDREPKNQSHLEDKIHKQQREIDQLKNELLILRTRLLGPDHFYEPYEESSRKNEIKELRDDVAWLKDQISAHHSRFDQLSKFFENEVHHIKTTFENYSHQISSYLNSFQHASQPPYATYLPPPLPPAPQNLPPPPRQRHVDMEEYIRARSAAAAA